MLRRTSDKADLKSNWVIASLAMSLLISCAPPPPKVRLQREWTANAEFAGDLIARDIAARDGVRLEVLAGSENRDPIRTVTRGDAEIGIASADRILVENHGGGDLVVLAVATNPSPVTFLSRIEQGIEAPDSLYGKRIGIQPGTNTEVVFDLFLRMNQIDRGKMTVVDSGWNGLDALVKNKLDVLAVFSYDEPMQLEARGEDPARYRQLDPAKWGCHLIGTVYFAKRGYLAENRDCIERVMRALVRGWEEAKKDPERAIDMVLAFDASLNRQKELASLRRLLPYTERSGVFLFAEMSDWEATARALVTIGKLPNYSPVKCVDYSVLLGVRR